MVNRWRTALSLAAAAVLLVAGCGSSASPAPSSAPSASAAPSTAASVAPSAVASVEASVSAPPATPSDQPLKIGWLSEPDNLNPLTTYTTEAVEVTQLLYDKLLDYDLNLKPEPSLATSFTYSTDG